MSIFFISTLYLSFILLSLFLHYPQVCCTSLWKWTFTIAAKSYQSCFFTGFLLDFRYLSSNLSSKNEKVALFQNILMESPSFITISLSWVVVVFFICLEKYLQKIGVFRYLSIFKSIHGEWLFEKWLSGNSQP